MKDISLLVTDSETGAVNTNPTGWSAGTSTFTNGYDGTPLAGFESYDLFVDNTDAVWKKGAFLLLDLTRNGGINDTWDGVCYLSGVFLQYERELDT
jgi:hypothetical protein